MLSNVKKIILCLFLILMSCEEKISESDLDAYKELMDIRMGHLGNAIIMQGRLLDSFNLSISFITSTKSPSVSSSVSLDFIS